MKTLLTLFLIIFSFCGYAQKHLYEYDDNGNRKSRHTVPLRIKYTEESKDSLQQKEKFSLKAYPNPFSEQITITLESDEELIGNERLLLYSETGQLLQEFRMNQKIKTIQTQELAKGKYILQLFRKEKSTSFILIKN